ncbi:DUF2073 domain-containing protein [Candidatus Woesearchaeota archaeon]|nr:DUF2073 domain-containing protein [Candidatus Woesearchaeota archaeon]
MLTLQYVPYKEIEHLSSLGRIRKLLNLAKENKIVLLQGRLTKEEEAEIIKATMEEINADFKGIELTVISPTNEKEGIGKLKEGLISMLLGDRQGMTIIGPATIVKEIKRDPDKIQLYMTEPKSKRKKSSKKYK